MARRRRVRVRVTMRPACSKAAPIRGVPPTRSAGSAKSRACGPGEVSGPPHITIYGGDYEHTLAVVGRLSRRALGLRGNARAEHIRADARIAALRDLRVLARELPHAAREPARHGSRPCRFFRQRAFRHGLAVTLHESPLESLAALAGKRVGVEDYSMTAAVWFRGPSSGRVRRRSALDHVGDAREAAFSFSRGRAGGDERSVRSRICCATARSTRCSASG